MGCKNSKGAGRIQPVGPAEIRRDNSRLKKCKSEMDADVDVNRNRKRDRKMTKSSKSRHSLGGSCASLDSDRSLDDRGFSATSKTSKHSADSGLGEDYRHVITEESDPDQVRRVEEEFVADQTLDLGISGTQCPVRTSAKDRERMQEAMIIQALREEGLITKPQGQGASGMSFEITAVDASSTRRPPPRLEKLERRRKKKKILTEDEIREKLERAERRKKRKEQERLEKIKELEKTNPEDALETFAKMQKNKENQVHQKLDHVSVNREKRLREIQEKLKEKQKRAEMVRKRKQLAVLEGAPSEQTLGEIPRGKQLEM